MEDNCLEHEYFPDKCVHMGFDDVFDDDFIDHSKDESKFEV